MLQITVPATEMFDERTNEFVYGKETVLQLEHSLLSLSKWESNWCKPFYSNKPKTAEETRDYIKCMTINPNVSDDVYYRLSTKNHEDIQKYIESTRTATTISERGKGKGSARRVITSELIYYWMVTLNIPFECQKWHLDRLFTLIQVCNIENQPKKKRNKQEQMDYYSRMEAINNARKQRLGSKG